MICPQCVGVEKLFDEKYAQRDLKRYLRKGPVKTTRLLIEAIRAEGVKDLSLLDIGGGIGAIQLELFEAGVSRALDVDAAKTALVEHVGKAMDWDAEQCSAGAYNLAVANMANALRGVSIRRGSDP